MNKGRPVIGYTDLQPMIGPFLSGVKKYLDACICSFCKASAVINDGLFVKNYSRKQLRKQLQREGYFRANLVNISTNYVYETINLCYTIYQ